MAGPGVDLERRADGVAVVYLRNPPVNALHPASLMPTTMVRLAGRPVQSTIEEGRDAILHLAAGAEMEGRTGLYFNGMTEAKADPQAYDPAAQAKLRALSFELCGLEDPQRR